MDTSLITKYNKAVPRYTSYPTVPYWQKEVPAQDDWLEDLMSNYKKSPELSIYIHLPFCESLCTYCGCNKRITKNHGVESPYIEAVIKEWKIYLSKFNQKPVIKEIHLGGGTPTFFDHENLRRLITTILDDAQVAEDHEFSFEAHPNSTTSDHLKTLYNLGFRRISIGVQDISPDILKAINRQQTSDEVKGLTKWARSIGYTSVNYDIIYGLPFQKQMDILKTVEFISENKPDRIAFYSYAHVPWKSANQRAFTLADVPTGVKKSDLYDLGRYILETEGYSAVGMDHFCLGNEKLQQAYKNGKMHRNFMGYTANYTTCSIALGASSISDSCTMYVQNEKNIEKYQALVNNGKLPIIKGHSLSSDEQIIRKHILNLMCRDHTFWQHISRDTEILHPLLPRLDGLVNDNLVTYNKNSISVTPEGKFFIRNICAALDPLFQFSGDDNQLFSKAI